MEILEPTPIGGEENGSGQSEDESDNAGRPDDDLFTQSDFQELFRKNCRAAYRRLDLGRYDLTYGPEDHYNDCWEKLLKSRHSLRLENIPNEKALAGYLYMLALNRGLSKYHEIKRQRPWAFPGYSAEEVPEVDSGVNLFREWAARELMRFTRALPDERRRALELWLEDNSYREVSKLLEKEGIKVSHVSVQKWVEAGIQFLVAKAS